MQSFALPHGGKPFVMLVKSTPSWGRTFADVTLTVSRGHYGMLRDTTSAPNHRRSRITDEFFGCDRAADEHLLMSAVRHWGK
jgi:hypothetical protein